jgi:hypothetical protein
MIATTTDSRLPLSEIQNVLAGKRRTVFHPTPAFGSNILNVFVDFQYKVWLSLMASKERIKYATVFMMACDVGMEIGRC